MRKMLAVFLCRNSSPSVFFYAHGPRFPTNLVKQRALRHPEGALTIVLDWFSFESNCLTALRQIHELHSIFLVLEVGCLIEAWPGLSKLLLRPSSRCHCIFLKLRVEHRRDHLPIGEHQRWLNILVAPIAYYIAPVLIILIILDLSCELPSGSHFFLSFASYFRTGALPSPNFLHRSRVEQTVFVVELIQISAFLKRALNAIRWVLDSLDRSSPMILNRWQLCD